MSKGKIKTIQSPNINHDNVSSSKYIVFIIVAICLLITGPIVNQILQISSPLGIDVAGDTGDWIGYFGNLLGSSVTIIVLVFTLWQNKINQNKQNENHDELKNLQIKTIVYTEKTSHLKDLIDMTSELSSLLNLDQISNNKTISFTKIEAVVEYEERLNSRKHSINKLINLLIFKIDLLIGISFTISESENYINYINDISNEYKELVNLQLTPEQDIDYVVDEECGIYTDIVDGYSLVFQNLNEEIEKFRLKNIEFKNKTAAFIVELKKGIDLS